MGDADNLDMIQDMISLVMEKLKAYGPDMTEGIEILLHIRKVGQDSDMSRDNRGHSCHYYLTSWAKRAVMWAEEAPVECLTVKARVPSCKADFST